MRLHEADMHRTQSGRELLPQRVQVAHKCGGAGALALLVVAMVVMEMAAPLLASAFVRSTSRAGLSDVDSIDVLVPGDAQAAQPLLWQSLAHPSSSAAQCILLATLSGRPSQQTCLFANVCVDMKKRSITMFNGTRAPDVELIPRACAGNDRRGVPVKLRSSPQSFPDFVNATRAPVYHGLWVWMDRYVDFNFAHTL